MLRADRTPAIIVALILLTTAVVLIVPVIFSNLKPVSKEQRSRARAGVTTNSDWEPVIRRFGGVDMVLVPSGCFQMGSTYEQLQEAMESCDRYYGVFECDQEFSDEQPAHEVCISQPYWIDLTPVTNAKYGFDRRTLDSVSGFGDPSSPRGIVTWSSADEFCARREARLPTEAEWEFAARGPEALIYPFGNEYAVEKVTLRKIGPAHVGEKPEGASWVGALDMSGGISEWVADWYGPYPGAMQVDPSGPLEGELRITRGGNWFAHASFSVRMTYREALDPEHATTTVGFRCVREFNPQ